MSLPLWRRALDVTSYRFGSIELSPEERRLTVDGRPVAIGARAFDVLIALAERPGHLVTKRELLDRVWAGLVVEENNLQVQIGTLRKLLGSQAIATIPGRGFRLLLEPGDRSHGRSAPHAEATSEARDLYGRAQTWPR